MKELRSKLELIALRHFNENSLYGLGEQPIQPKKLMSARAAHSISNENILFMYDETVFGVAKDRVVFTDKGIYWREIPGKYQKLDYHEIVESTAHNNKTNSIIYFFDRAKQIETNSVYYTLICDLRYTLIESFITYETYYKSALLGFEEVLLGLESEKLFSQIVKWLSQYKGLFLHDEDKSIKIREIAFNAYLAEKRFYEAKKELEQLKYKKPQFYSQGLQLLNLGIKKREVAELEGRRLSAYHTQLNRHSKKIKDPMPNKKEILEGIQKAVKNQDLQYLETTPMAWNYKDQYGMSALHYFALQVNEEGIHQGIKAMDLSIMDANIFGHDFIDLIGFACDSNIGDQDKNLVGVLENLNEKVDLKQIEDRIRFLKTGKGRIVYSYDLSESSRLLRLNQKLMSPDYFASLVKEIREPRKLDIDDVIKAMFAYELEEIENYPIKQEFETLKDYKERCQVFNQMYLSRVDFIEEYKRQNKSVVDKVNERLENENYYFIKDLLVWIEYGHKEKQLTKNLSTLQGVVEVLNHYFPAKEPVVEIGQYDADREIFYMKVDNEMATMNVPISLAKNFKEAFYDLKWYVKRVVQDGIIIDACIYEIEKQILFLPFKTRIL